MAEDQADGSAPAKGSDLHVILVEPRYSANVGSVARVCANFGVEAITVVGDVELTDPAGIMAVHAEDLLERATRVPTLADALAQGHHTVGFSAITSTRPQDHLRDGVELPEAAPVIHEAGGRSNLVFGREDYGLYNEELAACDLVVEIPVSPAYPSMNLSHAVAVALYELVGRRHTRKRGVKPATNEEIERLLMHAEHLARAGRYQEHKVLPTLLALRRVIGRANLTAYEYHRLMGLISEALKALDAWPVPDKRWSLVSQALADSAWTDTRLGRHGHEDGEG